MRYFRLLLCVIIFAPALFPHLGITDITPMDYSPPPTGGGVSPKAPHPTIRLDDQEVIIRLKPSAYTVDAVFHLFNTGETTTEWIGFPKNATGRGPGPLGKVMDFNRFEVSVNDRDIPFTEEPERVEDPRTTRKKSPSRPGGHYTWLMGRAEFPGQALTTIRVSYESDYDNCGLGCEKAAYIYGTGGYWKENIGKAVFIVDSAQRAGVDRMRVNFSESETEKHLIRHRLIAENLSKYEIRDFEPDPAGALTFMFMHRRAGEDGGINELVHAAMNGRQEKVQALLKKGVDVNAKGETGETPLMKAARGGHSQVAKLLLENGADVNAETGNGRTALIMATENAWMNYGQGQAAVAKLLIEHGARHTKLATAAFVGDIPAMQRFITEGADVNQKSEPDDQTMLMVAAMGGRPEAVKFLLDTGLSIEGTNKRGQTALMVAAAAGRAEVVKALLDGGADVNALDSDHRNALNHAVWLRGHTEAARAILDGGADINDPANRMILIHAAHGGHLELVKLLLERGADVNVKDWNGNTALSQARGKDIEEIEKALIAHGAKK